MGSSLARSAQEPSGGRLAGPRRTSLAEHLEQGGGQGLRVAVAMPGPRVNGILTAAGLRDRRAPERLVGTVWARLAASDDGATVGRLVVEASGRGLHGLRARALIHQNPYALVEGIGIALHATGLARAVIEVAVDDEASAARLRTALDEIVDHGWPAAPIDVFVGQDRSAALRTDIENVAHVGWIMTHGVRAFRTLGTAASPGTTLCTVVGDVASPGVFEVPFGVSIGTLVRDVAGGRHVKVVHRGLAQPVLTAGELVEPLCFEAPAGLGDGLFQVHDTSRSIVDVLWSVLHEQPAPGCRDCAIAGAEMAELLRRCRHGRAELGDLEALLWRSQSIADDHRCPRPRRVYHGVWSTVAAFVDEFVATIASGRPTPGSLPALPWSSSDDPSAIEPRWCDSPRLGPSLLLTEVPHEGPTRPHRVARRPGR